MKIKNIYPARKFLVGKKKNIRIKEVAFLKLKNNEQVVFNCFYPKKYDFVKKNWGYYATPSINSRLKNQGFKTWHCENNGDISIINRNLVFMIYLNNVDNGGTDFLYQHHKEEAVAGNLVIWPAFWTHTHRGVISSTDKKYIVTGWIYIQE